MAQLNENKPVRTFFYFQRDQDMTKATKIFWEEERKLQLDLTPFSSTSSGDAECHVSNDDEEATLHFKRVLDENGFDYIMGTTPQKSSWTSGWGAAFLGKNW